MKTDKLVKFFTLKTVLIFLALWIVVNLWMWFGSSGSMTLRELTGDSRIPDTMIWGYSAQSLGELLSIYGVKGRELYLSFQYKDFIYPLIYSTLLVGLLIRVRLPEKLNFVVLVPWIAAVFDYAENLMVRKMVSDFPNIKEGFAQASSMFTVLKWDLIFFSLAFIVVFGAWRIFAKRNPKKS